MNSILLGAAVAPPGFSIWKNALHQLVTVYSDLLFYPGAALLISLVMTFVCIRLLPRLDGKGRVAAYEVLVGTPPIQALIRENKAHQIVSVLETAGSSGMITLQRSLEMLCEKGLISPKDVENYGAI